MGVIPPCTGETRPQDFPLPCGACACDCWDRRGVSLEKKPLGYLAPRRRWGRLSGSPCRPQVGIAEAPSAKIPTLQSMLEVGGFLSHRQEGVWSAGRHGGVFAEFLHSRSEVDWGGISIRLRSCHSTPAFKNAHKLSVILSTGLKSYLVKSEKSCFNPFHTPHTTLDCTFKWEGGKR